MKFNYRTAAALMLGIALASGGMTAEAGVRLRQDDPFEKLKTYDFQNREAVAALQNMIQQAQADKAQTARIEQKLLTVLQAPNATFAGKQEACRMLWIVGTARSVPTLAKMLPDAQFSDIARYALERNADPSAGKALRAALTATKGKVRIGIINSIGDRGDAEAVASLKPFTTNADPLVAEAAISALGKVGTEEALAALRTLPAGNPLVGHAMLRCAERFAAAGKKPAAESLYLSLATAQQPVVVQTEALRGLVLLQSPRAASVALADLKSPDYGLQTVAARVGGGLADPKATARFIAAWPTLPVPAQIVLLTALTDRREAAATLIALRAIESQDAALRQAGIQSAGLIGGAKAVPRLLELAVKGQGGDRDAARQALASMPGAEAEQAILQTARQGSPEERATLMAVLADRPTPAAISTLMAAANGTDTRVAAEALRSLGRVGGQAEYGALVTLLATTRSDEVRDAARDAVVSTGQRLGDRDHAADPVLAALPAASGADKGALLTVLAETGSDRALEELNHAVASSDSDVKQAAVTALADNWADDRALLTLQHLAKSDGNKAIRVQALRGSLRLIGQDDKTPADAKVGRIANALTMAERPEEKRQALGILRDCRVDQAMELAAKLLDDPELFPEAADTVLYLAAPQRKDNRDEPAVKGTATTAALDKVILLTKDDNQRAQAQKLKG
jgi:HEAT repeat protein